MSNSLKYNRINKNTNPTGRFIVFVVFTAMALLFAIGCKKEAEKDPEPTKPWNPTAYELIVPQGFPDILIPDENPMTEEGVALGRRLFYDPILSADNSQSCASCHIQSHSFAENSRFSTGVDGITGKRNAMALINAPWFRSLNWDGSAASLENQAFEPVTNPIEMHNTWPNAVEKLKAHSHYPDLFFDAFGTTDFDSTHVVKALAQFERTLISSNSKWDRYLRGEVQLSQSESRGFEVFFSEKGDCFHCHSTILFTNNEFHNNGLNSVFADSGLFNVTGNPNDIGRFRTPTLRNVVFTAPYMHDGRFETLEEVIDFYSEGLQYSPTIDPLMKNVDEGGVRLTKEEKFNLLAFIKTLTDSSFVNNPAFANPFWMIRLSILCIVFTMAVYLDCTAQIPLVPYDSLVVSQNGIPLSNPWAGGLNSPQFSEIDLNNDGFKDLVAFERNFFGSVKTFINQGISGQSGYVHAPEYQTIFPKMSNWMLLRDYNCDGREDIFTSVPGGIAVYRNDVAPDGSIRFTRISNLLQTIDLSGNTIPLYVPVSDIPAIADIGGDGALDILSFNLIGNAVEYHRNKSIDLNGHCDELLFEIESACWGYFSEANNNNTLTLFDTCSGNMAANSNRQRHPGSTLLALDLYGNGLKDLLLSDINFNQVVRLSNSGSAAEASMTEQFTGFPENSNPVDITVFPAAYHLDVDNDGLEDLLFAPNNPNTSENHNNVWFYKNEGTASLPEFVFQQTDFLLDGMIDLGERSFPAFVDTDGDGLLDIVAGSYGYFESAGTYSSRLMLLQNAGTPDKPAFEIVSDDYARLSVYGFQGVYPCFGDIDGDGDMDMLVGDEEGRLHLFTNQAGPGEPADFVLTHPNYFDIDVGQSAKPQLVDVNDNGLPDLLIGERSGAIRFFENVGTVTKAVFNQQATHTNFGNINVLPDGFTGYSAPFLTTDSLGKPILYVGSEQGYLYLYNNIQNNLGGSFNLVDSLYLHGVNITPNGADISNDGKMELVYGQFAGGISLLKSGSPFFYHLEESLSTVGKMKLYPNPASDVLTVEVPELLQKGRFLVKVTNISGNVVYRQTYNGQNQSLSIDVDFLLPGVYFIWLEGEVSRSLGRFLK